MNRTGNSREYCKKPKSAQVQPKSRRAGLLSLSMQVTRLAGADFLLHFSKQAGTHGSPPSPGCDRTKKFSRQSSICRIYRQSEHDSGQPLPSCMITGRGCAIIYPTTTRREKEEDRENLRLYSTGENSMHSNTSWPFPLPAAPCSEEVYKHPREGVRAAHWPLCSNRVKRPWLTHLPNVSVPQQ